MTQLEHRTQKRVRNYWLLRAWNLDGKMVHYEYYDTSELAEQHADSRSFPEMRITERLCPPYTPALFAKEEVK